MKVHWSLWVALAILVLVIILLSRTREGYAPPRDENTEPPYVEPPVSNVAPDSQTQIYRDMGGMDYQIQAGNPILNFIQGDPSSNVIYGDFVPMESDGGSARMYMFESTSNTNIETSGTTQLTCPRSVVIFNGRQLGPGTHNIAGQDKYEMQLYPPLHVIATGPNNTRQEMTYPTVEECPSMVRLTLDTEKTFDTLNLSSNAELTQSLLPIPENPSFGTQVYGINATGNIVSSAQTTVTRDYQRDFLLNPSSAYLPELTSPNITFLGETLSASELPGSTTSPGATL